MEKAWVNKIKNQCFNQSVLFFFKQWGMYGEDGLRRSKKANGRSIDGLEYSEIPSYKLT